VERRKANWIRARIEYHKLNLTGYKRGEIKRWFCYTVRLAISEYNNKFTNEKRSETTLPESSLHRRNSDEED